jgi:pyruvate formate lyase activating enzyme
LIISPICSTITESLQVFIMKKIASSPVRKKSAMAGPAPSRAVIFDIQRFSLHDGPGIRTAIFFKGCPLRCAWCQNPESHEKKPEIAFYAELCRACFTCRKVCPEGAIIGEKERRVDYDRCTACGACAAACPAESLRLIGTEWDAASLAEEVLRDRDYFIDSGGGVTLTGGEPLVYPRFVMEFLALLKKERVHTAMETCGMFRPADMKKIIPRLDLVFYDLKHMDGGMHREYTGAGNRRILENFLSVSALIKNVQPRMPLVPCFNDGDENISATARFIKKAGHRAIHCLPYHKLGEAKLTRINTKQRPLGLAGHDADDLERIKKMFRKEGVDAIIYD